jgi:hypothetical protein
MKQVFGDEAGVKSVKRLSQTLFTVFLPSVSFRLAAALARTLFSVFTAFKVVEELIATVASAMFQSCDDRTRRIS